MRHFRVSSMCTQGDCRYALRQVPEEHACRVPLDIALVCWSSPPPWPFAVPLFNTLEGPATL